MDESRVDKGMTTTTTTTTKVDGYTEPTVKCVEREREKEKERRETHGKDNTGQIHLAIIVLFVVVHRGRQDIGGVQGNGVAHRRLDPCLWGLEGIHRHGGDG